MNLMNEKDTMDEIGNMDVFGHVDGMTFMDEIDQHPYIFNLIDMAKCYSFKWSNSSIKIISSMYWNFIQIV